jgi:hypothetical protein
MLGTRTPALLACLIPLLEVCPAWGAEAASAPSEQETESSWRVDASLVEEYRLRIAHGALPATGPLGVAPAADQKVDHVARAVADAQLAGADDHFLGVLSAALWWDLDGAPPRGTPNLFASQYDGSQPWWDVYTLSAEWHDAGALEYIRLGRQATEHGLPLTFDGASFGVRPAGPLLSLFGFGGRTVHFFETGAGSFENWVGSVGATLRPTQQLRIELDSRLMREEVLDRDHSTRDRVTNHALGLSGFWRSDTLYAKAYARALDQRFSHAGGALQLDFPSVGVGVDGRLDAQLVTLGELVESENPYYSLLGPSLPHVRFRLESWKELPLGEETKLSLYLGWKGRQLLHDRERAYNRNMGGLYFRPRLDDLVQKGIFVEGTAEYDYVPRIAGDQWSLALGGAAGYTGKTVRTEVGTVYQRFRINYYERAEELLNTRTVYGLVGYRVMPWLELRARYEFDILDRYLESFFFSARQDF